MPGMLAAIAGGALAGVGAGLVEDAKAQRDAALADTKYLQELAMVDKKGSIDLANNLQVTAARGTEDRTTQAAKLPEGVMLDANGNRVADPAFVSAKSQIAQAAIKDDVGKFQFLPGVGADPTDPTKQVAGIYKADVHTGELTFQAGAQLTSKTDLGSGAIPAPKDPNIHGDDYLSTLSPADAAQVKALAEGRLQFPTGFAAKSARAQSLITAVSQYDPSFDAVNFGQRAASTKAFATGKQGDTVRSLSVAVSHLDTLGKLSDALDNGDVQGLNAIKNAFQKQFGREAPTNFDAAKAIVGDEVVKAIVGTGGALADREEAKANISRANSPAQLKGVIATYQDLMAGQLGGLKQQYEQSTGRKNFHELLSPEARSRLMPETAPQTSPPAAEQPPVAGARKAPDGNWYVDDPARPGKYLKVNQ